MAWLWLSGEDGLLEALEAPTKRLEAFLVSNDVQTVVLDRGDRHGGDGLRIEGAADQLDGLADRGLITQSCCP